MTEKQTCIVCEGQASFFMNHRENKLDYYKCSRCHSGFSLPEKSNKTVSQFYNSNYYNKCNEHFDKHREIFLKNLEDINFNEFEKELTGEKKCLDIGCANGNFLELMYHRKWKIYGIDQTDCVSKKIKDLGEFKCKNVLEKVDSWKNTFDLVHCCHVIEHISYPSRVIDTIHYYLKPQGRTIIIAPNLSGLESSLNYPASLVDPTHLVNYSLKGLILLLSKSRFRILDYITWGGFRQSRIQKALLPLLKELDMGDVFMVYAEKI